MAAKKDEEIRGLHRLSDEQVKALEETKEAKKKWEKFRSDYEALRKKLQTLPDKLTHDVMVPFGPLAFMPGKLVHSNEIMVLLGDDWFAERSAKQACQIVDRRIKAIDEQLKGLQDQWRLLDSRKEFTDQFLAVVEERGDSVEVTEDYDEENEREWRESHKLSLRKQRKQIQEEQMTDLDAELMNRLEELEREEEEREERWKDYEKNLVKDTDAVPESRDGSDDEGSESGSENEEAESRCVIRFKHTQTPGPTSSKTGDDDTSCTTIQSPADVYRLFTDRKQPKSILKKSPSFESTNARVHFQTSDSETSNIASSKVGEVEVESETRETKVAFTGQIKERNSETINTEQSVDQQREAAVKKVSKFKQQRMKQTNRR